MFVMSVFSIPKGICKEITDIIAHFLWADDEETKKCIGWHGGSCAFRKVKGEWDSETYIPST